MAVLGGIHVFPARAQQLGAWQAGRITPADLDQALRQLPQAQAQGITAQQCTEALQSGAPVAQLPLLIDVLDNDPRRHTRLSWRQAITHLVSQTCAAYFDEHQADWQPERAQGLYAFWRDTLQHDHGIGLLMGLPDLGAAVGALPTRAEDAERWVLQRLGLPQPVWTDYLEAVLLTVNGWASWCAYLGWQASLEGRIDPHLRELLAIRLAWGVLLLECKDNAASQQAFATVQRAWRCGWPTPPIRASLRMRLKCRPPFASTCAAIPCAARSKPFGPASRRWVLPDFLACRWPIRRSHPRHVGRNCLACWPRPSRSLTA